MAYEGAYTEKKLAVNALYCIDSFIFERTVYALLALEDTERENDNQQCSYPTK